ncbi:MAG TPA: hypothetical protein PKC24_12390 [Cyclobacteriaceae bacterium]|nr:hypothetical protein [Cyclobacteriaceae bacterium]
MRFALIITILISTLAVFGQENYDYTHEFTWGVNKNSSSGLIGGFVFKKSKRLNERVFETYGLEIMNVKHSQERRYNARFTGNFFIYGKSNYLYTMRMQYGRELLLFSKAAQQGVEVKAISAIGPSLGFETPYYIERALDSSFRTVREPYDPNNPLHNFFNILGPGRLFEGVPESKIVPGVNFKMAISFELSPVKSQVAGFEVGFLADAYSRQVILMPTAENSAVFPTVFISLYYGNRR